MKSRERLVFLLSSSFVICNSLLIAEGAYIDGPHYEWFGDNEVALEDDGVYVDSNKGMAKLNVVEYDEENHRYKVLCSCSRAYSHGSIEALSYREDENE